MLVMPVSFELLKQEDIWICDTGASTHSTYNKGGATNERQTGSASLGHAGTAVKAESTIDIPGRFVTRDGSYGIKATLQGVSYNRQHNFDLLSLTRLLYKQGWVIEEGNKRGITIMKNGQERIKFDIVVPTPNGALYACRFLRNSQVSSVQLEVGAKIGIQKAHELLGHKSEDNTRAAAKALGWVITRGTMKPCLNCARSKAKQKNVIKKSVNEKSVKPCERLYLDLTKVTVPREDGGEHTITRKHWRNFVDEATGKKWCDFTMTKDGMVEPACEFLHILKKNGMGVRKVRLDPSGENESLEKRTKTSAWKELQPLEFEFTSRDTPQHNHLVELSFPHISGQARAMMGAANIPIAIRPKVAIEAIKCATQLDGLSVVKLGDKLATRDVHVYGKNAKWAKQLRTFGEAGVCKEGKNAKTGDRGQDMMFVGYPMNREEDSVRMWNPQTNRVVVTRDVIWLKRMFYVQENDDGMKLDEWSEAQDEKPEPKEEKDGDSYAEYPAREIDAEAKDAVHTAMDDGDARPVTTRSGREIRAPDRLTYVMEAHCDLTSTAIELRYQSEMAEIDHAEVTAVLMTRDNLEVTVVGAGVGGGFSNTNELKVMNYREAMKSKQAAEWTDEVSNEKDRFDKYKAVSPVPRNKLPAGTKILTSTWAMKTKSNGKLRGRLNLRGYEQQDGEHYFSDSIAAPVTNANTIRTMLIFYSMMESWECDIMDVEGAFLQGEFADGEELHMKVPDGWEKFYPDDVVLKVNVPIYGMKQAGSCFYKTFVKRVKHVPGRRYDRSKADPCLYFVWSSGRLALMASWVDDLIMMGSREDLDMIRKDLEGIFDCKHEGTLKEYVGSKIDVTIEPDGRKKIKFTQPVLIQKLRDEYEIPGGRAPRTPALAGQTLVKGDGSGTLDEKGMTMYRSGTATCMFMMQWSRPDIQNATRGLARHMSAPRLAHEKALGHLMKYLVETPNRGLVIFPDGTWDGSKEFKHVIHGRSDSDYANCTDDRRSVSGGRTFLNGAPAMIRSSTQRTVTLSVTEAESAAGVVTAQDMLCVYRLLKSIGLGVELPMVLEMDNRGAVELANNWSVGGRTRHIDVKNYFLRELKDQGILVVKHVAGDSNDADIFTKNTTTGVFERHLPKFVGKDEYYSTKL